MVDVSERGNGVKGRERGDRANSEYNSAERQGWIDANLGCDFELVPDALGAIL